MMNPKVVLGKYSIGMGDRFAQEAMPQLEACRLATKEGICLVPVWNKSNREHLIVGSEPSSVREAAKAAVQALEWKGSWHVDADHIRLDTVDRFLDCSDFFTIDVAEAIGGTVEPDDPKEFVRRHPEFTRPMEIPGISRPLQTSAEEVQRMARKILPAAREAARIYRRIAAHKGEGGFIAEVSMDETDVPQTPIELLLTLAALADEQVPLQTIAPKFTGRFNKGVDYVGDLAAFEKEFHEDLRVLAHAVRVYGLPANLKLSVHSGSDKKSIYPVIHQALKQHGVGLHLKTAGTTWLEEVISLAESGGEGLSLAREIYAESFAHREELCQPYATVIDIDRNKLPDPQEVCAWPGEQLAACLRHEQNCPDFNPHMRQLVHVGFKIAAKMGPRYLTSLRVNRSIVAKNVTANLFKRHIRPVFPPQTKREV